MKLIYMKSTIDFIASKHNHKISAIENIGIPESKEHNKAKYFMFTI